MTYAFMYALNRPMFVILLPFTGISGSILFSALNVLISCCLFSMYSERMDIFLSVSSSWGSRYLIVDILIFMARFILRPPLSCIPLKFLNESLSSVWVGTVTIVLSQFCILTLLRLICRTSPSAPYFGISLQSPTRTESLADACMLATNARMVSLHTSIQTGGAAPRETNKGQGEFAVMMETAKVPPTENRNICST